MKRVLVADDTKFIRDIIIRTLKDSGYSVDYISDGNELTETLNVAVAIPALKYNVIVLDLTMPDIDIKGVLETLRGSSLKDVPILMSVAQITTKDAVELAELGVDNFILKPFVPDELLKRVNILAKIDSGV